MNIKSDTLKGILFVNIATFSWTTNMILGRYIRGSIGPLTLTAARFTIASIIFAFLLGKLPKEERSFGRDLPLLGAMALTGVVLFAPVLYLGLRFTTAVNSTLINGLGPILTAIFASWFIREPLTGRQLAGSLFAFTGVAVLISGASMSFFKNAVFNQGDLLIILAVTIWALYSVAGRKTMKKRSPLSASALCIFMGLPFLIAAAAFELQSIPVILDMKLILIVLYIGIVPAALGFFCWNVGVGLLGAGGAMVYYNTIPLYGALLGFLFLGETIGAPHIMGGLLIIGGGLIAALKKREK
ncbi:MAG: DMT family transporter [Spirochaetia bacterium]|jgi:drug/metabolite transporter (DMT)-like permease|nr:DMT family transporter [Spirochaetia bacterium]